MALPRWQQLSSGVFYARHPSNHCGEYTCCSSSRDTPRSWFGSSQKERHFLTDAGRFQRAHESGRWGFYGIRRDISLGRLTCHFGLEQVCEGPQWGVSRLSDDVCGHNSGPDLRGASWLCPRAVAINRAACPSRSTPAPPDGAASSLVACGRVVRARGCWSPGRMRPSRNPIPLSLHPAASPAARPG